MKITKYSGEFDVQIDALTEAMRYKLGVHADKGPWKGVPLSKLLEVMQDEVKELHHACAEMNVLEAVHECGDVAICAMMVLETVMRMRTLKDERFLLCQRCPDPNGCVSSEKCAREV